MIDRYAAMREHYGDYQRQLFLIDHAGLPLKTVLEQLDILGSEVVPVLRKELANDRPSTVPDAPTHAARVQATYGDGPTRQARPGANRGDNLTGTRPTRTRRLPREPRSDSAGRRPDMTTRRIAVVSAGLSNPSSTRMLADRLAAETVKALAERDIEATVDVIELRDHAHDITNNMLTGFAPPALETAINTVVSADALIAVTPIFSTSYSGLFKSFIDVLDPDALTGKPVLIGANAGTPRHSLAIDYAIRPQGSSRRVRLPARRLRVVQVVHRCARPDALTGKPVLIGANAGTPRHSLAIDYAIRPLFAYLHAEAVSTGVFAASSDWGGAGDDVAPLAKRVEKGARELAEAVARREAATVVDPFDPATYLGEGRSFGHMLGGLAGE